MLDYIHVTYVILFSCMFCSCFISVGCGQDLHRFEMDMSVYIKNVHLDNNTASVNVNLWIRNFSLEASFVYVIFSNIDDYAVDCEYQVGHAGKYQFLGKLTDKSWFLDGVGELFPFDFYIITFELHDLLEYRRNNTNYGLPQWSYYFNDEHTLVDFLGLHKSRLDDEWEIFDHVDDGTYEVFLFRKEEKPSYQFMFPLILIQALIALAPSLTDDKTMRVRLFSSVLVFSPMFILAIQNFIPPRNTLSIPEFLGVSLMFFSTSMIFASMISERNKKWGVLVDVGGIVISFLFFYLLKISIYSSVLPLLSLPHIKIWFILIALIFLAAIVVRLAFSYKEMFSLDSPEGIEQDYVT